MNGERATLVYARVCLRYKKSGGRDASCIDDASSSRNKDPVASDSACQ